MEDSKYHSIDDHLLELRAKGGQKFNNFTEWYEIVKQNPLYAPTFFIAEIGLNHNGDVKRAAQMIRLAEQAGANAVKFQAFVAEELIHPEVDFLQEALHIFHANELSFSDFRFLADVAAEVGVDFLATPFSPRMVHFLQELYVPAIKIASGDINNFLLLREAAKSHKPIILSTGASNEQEVEDALEFLSRNGNSEIVLLHCLSEYPAELSRVGWFTLPWLQDRFNLPIGFSDHTLGLSGAIVAVGLGARIIEKHFTISRQDAGVDQAMSTEVEEFQQMVETIRSIEDGFGTYGKEPTEEEVKGNSVGRRGLYYRADFPVNHIVQYEDIMALRPQNGISPADIELMIGKRLAKDVITLEPVAWEDFF